MAGVDVVKLMRGGVEQADEGGDEAVLGQGLGEQVVEVQEGQFQLGAQAQRHAQHGVHLRHRQRRANAMPGGVAQHHQQLAVDQRQVKGVAAGQRGRARQAVAVVAGQRGHVCRQRAGLHQARHFELLPHHLAAQHGLRSAGALQGHGALRGQCLRQAFVGLVEHAVGPVQHLHHPDQCAVVVQQRQRQAAARVEARTAVGRGVESRVGVAVGHVDELAVARAQADQPGTHRHAHGRDVSGDLQHHLVRGGVVQPHRAALGVQHLPGRGGHRGQHGQQLERRGQLARDLEQLLKAGRVESAGRACGNGRRPCRGR